MGRMLRWGLLQLCQSLVNGLYSTVWIGNHQCNVPLYRMNDCFESVRPSQRYYNRSGIFRSIIQSHKSLHFLQIELVIQLLCQEECTQARF